MAVVAPTISSPSTLPMMTHVSWAIAGAVNTYGPVEIGPDRSIQMAGTWNGATIKMEGSNDDVTYFPLTDPQGNAIAFTADAIEQISEICRFVKPVITAGTPTAVTAVLTAGRKF